VEPAVAAVDPTASLSRDLTEIFSTAPASGALWGIRIESLDHPGEPLFALNADHLFVPASNMKLLTVAAAATRLGWDHTFETTVRATTPLGSYSRNAGRSRPTSSLPSPRAASRMPAVYAPKIGRSTASGAATS